jgi:hypothetical protein
MGGGNAAKSAAKRAANAKKAQKAGKSGGSSKDSRAAALNHPKAVVCEVCRASILNIKQMSSHYDAKHSKLPYPQAVLDLQKK